MKETSNIRHSLVYLEVDLFYDGYYGKMAIDGQQGSVHHLSTSPRSSSKTMNYDDTNFNHSLCQTFIQFYHAIGEFSHRSQSPLPFSLLEIRTDSQSPKAIAPSVINLPGVTNVSSQSSRQLFGRALLYEYDKNVWKKTKLLPWRQASFRCDEKLEEWLAFREGWVNFWADKCYGKSLKQT